MRQLALAIVAFLIIVVGVQNLTVSRGAALTSVATTTARGTAEGFYESYRDFAMQYLAGQIAASPAGALTAPPGRIQMGYRLGTESVSATIEGDTLSDPSSTTVFSANLNSTLSERRVALNIDVVPGSHTATIRHHLILSIVASSPFVTLLSDTITSSTVASTYHAATDVGGCAGGGAGCDPLQVQAADDARTHSALTCDPGIGSGTCPTGNQYDDSSYSSATWGDSQ